MEKAEYTVTRIDGDYALLVRTDDSSNQEMLVARALLPESADENTQLIYEAFSYSVKE